MSVNFSSYFYSCMPENVSLQSPNYTWSGNVSSDEPATEVMTDFQVVRPFSIEPMATIEDANNKMIACGVRLLFVCDINGCLAGLITSVDILGERPINYLREHGGSRDSILVQDVMTKVSALEALDIRALMSSTVGDIVQLIQRRGRQHVLVFEQMADGSPSVRGIFSSTQIERQLGTAIPIIPRANTFAELGIAIVN